MPRSRHPNRVCPVCLKPYNSEFWLNKHIDAEHPRYRARKRPPRASDHRDACLDQALHRLDVARIEGELEPEDRAVEVQGQQLVSE